VAAPAVMVASTIAARAGEEPAKIALILMSAALAAGTVWMLWLVTGDVGAVAMWLSFAYVWLLASEPELFAVSQAVLVATLLLVRRKVTDLRVWGGMVLLAGGVTVTNVVKPIAALAVTFGRDGAVVEALRRHARKFLLGIGSLLAFLAVVEVCKWYFIDGMSPAEEIATGWNYIAKWFSGDFSFGERLRRIWEMFFLEPVMTHGAIFSQSNAEGLDLLPLGYGCLVPHVLGAGLLVLCIWSAWRNRGEAVIRAALAMVVFDFLLHVVLGWGLIEAQIYCGHWFYVFPVLIAGLGGRWWKYALAAVIAAWNLQFIGAVT